MDDASVLGIKVFLPEKQWKSKGYEKYKVSANRKNL